MGFRGEGTAYRILFENSPNGRGKTRGGQIFSRNEDDEEDEDAGHLRVAECRERGMPDKHEISMHEKLNTIIPEVEARRPPIHNSGQRPDAYR